MKTAVVTFDTALTACVHGAVKDAGYQSIACSTLSAAIAETPDLILAEWRGDGDSADILAGLETARCRANPIPVVVFVPPGGVTLMYRAKAAGAADVLLLPPDPQEIKTEIAISGSSDICDPALLDRFRQRRREVLIGESPPFQECMNEMLRAAMAEANILVMGETGTGKELIAAAIHALSRRRADPYMAVNCAGLTSSILESELFGHVKGAFTDANKDRIGRFEAVGAGTLLLDEIGDLESTLQIKLLRVIEQRVFQKVGSNDDVHFYARLICATSVNLDEARAAGRFRQDFLGRIDQMRIELPPLRKRQMDIRILARFFLRKHAKGRAVDIGPTAMELLEAFDFPKNVRQLENAIIAGLARTGRDGVILPRHLPKEIVSAKAVLPQSDGLAIQVPGGLSYAAARDAVLGEFDRLYLGKLLQKHTGNRSHAAKEAVIDRKTFGARIGC